MKHKIFRPLLALFITLSLIMTVGVTTPVRAATTWTVTNNNDSGSGSLRQAILDASDGDTIDFDANYIITLNSQLPVIDKTLTINGNGAENTIIQASTCNPITLPGGCTPATDKVIEISWGVLTLDALTVRHGSSGGIYIEGLAMLTMTNSTITSNIGGGILNLGGVDTIVTITNSTVSGNHGSGYSGAGTLNVTNSTFSDNSSNWGGGGIDSLYATLTITESTFLNNTAEYYGGAIYANGSPFNVSNSIFSNNTAIRGGSIYTDAFTTLNVTNTTFSNNNAFSGGAIYNFDRSGSGAVVVENSTFSNNSATSWGGAIVSDGPAVYNVTNSTFASNSANQGGGILNLGTLRINNSTFTDNSADVDGGAISNYSDSGVPNSSKLTMTNSTLFGNFAYSGGGIFNSNYGTVELFNTIVSENTTSVSGSGIRNLGILNVTESTVMNNSATSSGVSGAGITNEGFASVDRSSIVGNISTNFGAGINNWGIFRMKNSTISGNSPGGIVNTSILGLYNVTVSNNTASFGSAGVYSFSPGIVSIYYTILAGNSGPVASPDCFGSLYSLGYNLIHNTSGCTINGATTGNILGINPMLGPLQDNGGPTFTHALLPGSPAIDAGNPLGCLDNFQQSGEFPLTIDQRNVARSQGTACDIGAYEFVSTIDVTIDIKPGSDTNPINTKSKGKTPVAILSSADFDAPAMVDTSSLTFGKTGDESSMAFCDDEPEDVNGDGLFDLVCHFHTKKTGFQIGDPEGVLRGMTIDDISLEGSDNVRVRK